MINCKLNINNITATYLNRGLAKFDRVLRGLVPRGSTPRLRRLQIACGTLQPVTLTKKRWRTEQECSNQF